MMVNGHCRKTSTRFRCETQDLWCKREAKGRQGTPATFGIFLAKLPKVCDLLALERHGGSSLLSTVQQSDQQDTRDAVRSEVRRLPSLEPQRGLVSKHTVLGQTNSDPDGTNAQCPLRGLQKRSEFLLQPQTKVLQTSLCRNEPCGRV
jgi:hypothetical protein